MVLQLLFERDFLCSEKNYTPGFAEFLRDCSSITVNFFNKCWRWKASQNLWTISNFQLWFYFFYFSNSKSHEVFNSWTRLHDFPFLFQVLIIFFIEIELSLSFVVDLFRLRPESFYKSREFPLMIRKKNNRKPWSKFWELFS